MKPSITQRTPLTHRPPRGAALMLALMFLMLLGTMAVVAIQTISFDARVAESAGDSHLLRRSAQACVDVVKRWVDEAGTGDYSRTTRFMLPPPNITGTYDARSPGTDAPPASEYRNHPIIGDCWQTNARCVDFNVDLNPANGRNEIESYCCCRTGYLFDAAGNTFSYSRNNTNHFQIVSSAVSGTSSIRDALPTLITDSRPIGLIYRFGSPIGHLVPEKSAETSSNPQYRQLRLYLTVTSAVRLAVKEFQVAFLVSGIPNKK